MIKPIWRYYKSVNDSLDIIFEENFSTTKIAKTPKWIILHLTAEGKPGMFWIKHYSEHKEELKAMYPEYDFETQEA